MKTLLARLVLASIALAVLPAHAQIAFRAAASATAAGVTPAFRAAASAATTSATLTITKPSGTATNDVLVASIAVAPSSVAITAPSGWTLVRRLDNAGPTSNSLAVYYKVAIAGEPASYAWGVSGASFAVGGVQGFTGIDTASPIDVENGQSTPSATTHAAPAVTSNVANAMLVASHAFASSRTWTPPSGMAESFDRPSGANSATGLSVEASRVLMAAAGSSGTKTATAAGNADAGNAHLLALRPASASLSVPTPAGTAAGDVMIAAIGFNNSGAAITPPSGWTLVRRMNNSGTTSNALAVYRKSAAAGEPGSHVWGVAGGAFLVGGIQSFSGVDGANPIDAESGQSTASSTNHDTPSITTSTANTMLVTSHTFASSRSWTAQAGLIESFERLSGAASTTGQSITGTRQAQAAAGASGTKRSTAASSADVGNTHILALRQVQVQVQALHFIHVDHLNTPRLVANAQGQTVWRWDQAEPFGNNPADENPSGLGIFDLPLRLPGQYFDKEANLHYNYYRDYDPGTGRYVESDPIGLDGGLNTYAYALSNPVGTFDPDGLQVRMMCRLVDGLGAVLSQGLYGGQPQKHCFVYVSCPEENWAYTLSLFGNAPFFRSGWKSKATPLAPNTDDPNSPNLTNDILIQPSQPNCPPCAFEKDVLKRFNALPATLPYSLFSMNSNSFASSLVTSRQFGTSMPPNAISNAPTLGVPYSPYRR